MKKLTLLLLLMPLILHAQNFRGLDQSPMDQAKFPPSNRVTEKVAIITPDVDIIPGSQTLNPAYIVFSNYEKILKWNRSLRFALAVCTLKDKFKDEL